MLQGRELENQLRGWGLTTAEIRYGMPDYRDLIQIFLWQEYDQVPKFPRLHKFLDFWTHKIEGPLRSVRIAHNPIIGPAELKYIGNEWRLN